ncbi:MAG: hypothetical protein AAF184_15540 [Pseudomonadota bacterium]
MTGRLIPLAAAALLTAPLVCPTALAGDRDQQNEEQAAATAKGSKSYTWDELVDLIPELEGMTVEYPQRKAGVPADEAVAQEPRLCRKETVMGSRIPKRRCYTLDQLVAEITESRALYKQIIGGQMTFGMIGDGGE